MQRCGGFSSARSARPCATSRAPSQAGELESTFSALLKAGDPSRVYLGEDTMTKQDTALRDAVDHSGQPAAQFISIFPEDRYTGVHDCGVIECAATALNFGQCSVNAQRGAIRPMR